MADEAISGMQELLARFHALPRRIKQSVLRGWATAQANRMASRLRPMIASVAFNRGRLVGSIQGKAVRSPRALSVFKAIARAIAYSSNRRGGYAFNPLSAGTRDRWTKSGIQRNAKSGRYEKASRRTALFGKRGFRGRISPPRRFMERFAPNVHAAVTPGAMEDLSKRIQRALSKNGG